MRAASFGAALQSSGMAWDSSAVASDVARFDARIRASSHSRTASATCGAPSLVIMLPLWISTVRELMARMRVISLFEHTAEELEHFAFARAQHGER